MQHPLPKLQQIPPTAVSVGDYEGLARERVSASAWAFLSGGATDEWTARENIAAYQRLTLRTRVLEDLSGGNTAVEIFGQRFAAPILLAPVAYHRLFHPDGELGTVLAAAAMQTGVVVSTQATTLIEDVARQAKTPLWFQLYVQADRDLTAALVRRAEAAGYTALVVTVDAPVTGIRNREQRAGFALPSDLEAVNLRGMRVPSMQAVDNGQLLLGGPLLASAMTWRDVAWLRSLTRLPLLAKGIMTAEDAQRAVAEGFDGIIVSNHGGRTLDTQPATIDVLAETVAAVGDRVPVLCDGGVRRGSDVFKALALGAKAVLIGRPYVYGLAAAGAAGVAHVIRILRAELEVTMALCGCKDLNAIDTARIRHAP
ncbi:alpha-hydroxy-acid oxidizing protein [Pseudolabrys taiwanensis]|uniref:Alpha-hydroxy-acid oxidizing protein n=1 Tax=Pseudolabrys taiwanensis TaxID=331696 RepID=A0A345ZUM6_9HYPH|nr:alpha-hydroxy acid oxidase [Pseudolabrys taiwanensis]AXK80623.1 alpha-hydroxy-acid oxidizing protein [Pseudolabrys taiwanensis]